MNALKPPTRVKICGLTRLEDAQRAVELGAWALGFIFHPKSPRYIEPPAARVITDSLGAASVKRVGVFVNAAADDIRRIVREAGLTTVQLHGDESGEFCRQLGLDVIKAVRPAKAEELDALAAYRELDAILVDAPPVAGKEERGGTGRLAEWKLARGAKRYGHVILSGGLNAENVCEAIRAVAPYAIDVSSGVEDSPGVKNAAKLAGFFEQVERCEI